MFACDHAGISPDIMCISKGLTGGYMPMAITITTEKIYQAFYSDYNEGKAFMHSHTYSGNPLGCSAAHAVLDVLEEDYILERANETAKHLKEQMHKHFENHRNVGEIRTLGLINAMELVIDKETKEGFDSKERVGYQIYKEALKEGLILRPLGNVLYFNPPLTITKEEIDVAIARTEIAMNKILG